MNIKVIISISLSTFLIASCLTTSESQYFESYNLDSEIDTETTIDTSVELPQISLFVSAPYEENESPITELLISETELPETIESVEEIVPPEPEKIVIEAQKIAAAPVRTQTIPEPPSEPKSIPPPEPEIISSTAQSVSTQPTDIVSNIEAELESVPDEEVVITLEGEGWIFDSNSSNGEVELLSREFSKGNTEFLFLPKESGTFVLLFLLQNSDSGNEERITYILKALNKDSAADLPVVIDPFSAELDILDDETTDPALLDAVEEENVPELLASIDQLISPESNPGSEILLNAFDLLEKQGGYDKYLVELAENSFRLYPYDHYSAEMLFRAAQGLEGPGVGQDIEKAVNLFKLVRDYFPLSVFSDRSEERIRYLERHFMKIY